MFDLIEMPGFPVPFPRHTVCTVSSLVDLILNHDLSIMDVINGMKKQVIKGKYIIEYNTGYIAELMQEMRHDRRYDEFSDNDLKTAITDEYEEMFKLGIDELKRIIFEELIYHCGSLPLHDVARMLDIKYETAHKLLERAKIKMRKQATYDVLKGIKISRKPMMSIQIRKSVFVEMV